MITLIKRGDRCPLCDGTCERCGSYFHASEAKDVLVADCARWPLTPTKIPTHPQAYIQCPECGNEKIWLNPFAKPKKAFES